MAFRLYKLDPILSSLCVLVYDLIPPSFFENETQVRTRGWVPLYLTTPVVLDVIKFFIPKHHLKRFGYQWKLYDQLDGKGLVFTNILFSN